MGLCIDMADSLHCAAETSTILVVNQLYPIEGNIYFPYTHIYRASLVAQLVKNPTAIQENLIQFLGQEDLLEKG